jgi:hypothetical protein
LKAVIFGKFSVLRAAYVTYRAQRDGAAAGGRAGAGGVAGGPGGLVGGLARFAQWRARVAA